MPGWNSHPEMELWGPGRYRFQTGKDTMMGLKVRYRGQNLVEYALVVAIIAAAAVAMSTYVFRAVQSKQKAIGEEFQRE